MTHLDLTFPTPAKNLAFEEALLNFAEETGSPGFLRFWESETYFVVLGYAKKFQEEVNAEFCRSRGIPVFRRCTGGGTVLQGPGCLNYGLVLPISREPEFQSITGTNHFIMERHRAALETVLKQPVRVRGHTDLTCGDLKFSGNSQRRKKDYLLFHGSFLWSFDLKLIEEALQMPLQQPDYRGKRSHLDFVTNIHAQPSDVKNALIEGWSAIAPATLSLAAPTSHLISEKYGTDAWNYRF